MSLRALFVEKVIPGVIGAVLTAALFALFGLFGKSVITILVPPQAVVAFHSESCPEGWPPYAQAQGRYVVGLKDGGALAASVGAELSDKEDRPTGNHTHAYGMPKLSGNTHGGVGPGGFSRAPVSLNTGSAIANSKAVAEGTNAPYVQLLYCIKD